MQRLFLGKPAAPSTILRSGAAATTSPSDLPPAPFLVRPPPGIAPFIFYLEAPAYEPRGSRGVRPRGLLGPPARAAQRPGQPGKTKTRPPLLHPLQKGEMTIRLGGAAAAAALAAAGSQTTMESEASEVKSAAPNARREKAASKRLLLRGEAETSAGRRRERGEPLARFSRTPFTPMRPPTCSVAGG